MLQNLYKSSIISCHFYITDFKICEFKKNSGILDVELLQVLAQLPSLIPTNIQRFQVLYKSTYLHSEQMNMNKLWVIIIFHAMN